MFVFGKTVFNFSKLNNDDTQSIDTTVKINVRRFRVFKRLMC